MLTYCIVLFFHIVTTSGESAKFMSTLKVGDRVWIIPGNKHPALLAIRCTITEIQQERPDDIPFFWIDQPIGHSLGEEELILTRSNAKKFLGEMIRSERKMKREFTASDLNTCRKRFKSFIKKTWERAGIKHTGFPRYKRKKKGVEWFTLR